MPCTYEESAEEIRAREEAYITKRVNERTAKLKAELDLATRVACTASKLLEKNNVQFRNKELRDWIQSHKAMDEKREE